MLNLSGAALNEFKENYQQQGYLVIRNFFSDEEMHLFETWTTDISRWPTVSDKWLKYYEILSNQEKVLSRVENFVAFHLGFSALTHDPVLLQILNHLMDDEVLFFKEKLNLKAGGAKGYTPHQDAPAFFSIDYDAITLFMAIDAATRANGCLSFAKIPTNFQPKMLPQNTPNRALSSEVVDRISWEPIECQPGDIILFSSYAPHYSTENKTQTSRRALFFSFGRKTKTINKTAKYYRDKRILFPQDSEKKAETDYTDAATIYSFSSPVIVNVKHNDNDVIVSRNNKRGRFRL